MPTYRGGRSSRNIDFRRRTASHRQNSGKNQNFLASALQPTETATTGQRRGGLPKQIRDALAAFAGHPQRVTLAPCGWLERPDPWAAP